VITDDAVVIIAVVVIVMSALLGCSFEESVSATAEVTAVVSFGCVLQHSGRIRLRCFSRIHNFNQTMLMTE